MLLQFVAIQEMTCPACDMVFKSISGKNSHLKQAHKCAWYNQQQHFPVISDSDSEEDHDRNNNSAIDLIHDDISLSNDGDYLEENFSPHRRTESNEDIDPEQEPEKKKQKIDDQPTVVDHHPTAGTIKGQDQTLRDKWASYFGGPNGQGSDKYYPFTSEIDWKFAKWLVEEDIE